MDKRWIFVAVIIGLILVFKSSSTGGGSIFGPGVLAPRINANATPLGTQASTNLIAGSVGSLASSIAKAFSGTGSGTVTGPTAAGSGPKNTYTVPGGGTVSGWSEEQAINLLGTASVDPVTQLTPSQTLTGIYGYSPDDIVSLESSFNLPGSYPQGPSISGPTGLYAVDTGTSFNNPIMNEQAPSTNYGSSGVSLDTAGSADYFVSPFGDVPFAGA
jgi:hypothetical protein